jgi:excisionase family DNA binding protein
MFVAWGSLSDAFYIMKVDPNCSMVGPRALKLKEAANYLGVSIISIRRLIKRGLIKPNRALRHLLISVTELDRFLAEGQR